jgi:hypothetical protein
LLTVLRRGNLGQEASRSRPGERDGRPLQRLQHDELPDPGVARDEQESEQALSCQLDEVGAEHQAPARKPVGPHSAGQQEGDRWHEPRREDVTEIRR